MSGECYFIYGTSGFRAEAIKLPIVVQRTAFYAALRARELGKAIGLMITASHNPAQDNGVKLVDPNGQMLPMDCEQKLTEIVNASAEEFAKYQAVARRFTDKTQEEQMTRTIVVIATDTRQSSPTLCQEAMIGVEKLEAPFEVRLFDRHTTPQLHLIVRAINDKQFAANGDYISRFRKALATSVQLIPTTNGSSYSKHLFVDCANGVGALWVDKYLAELNIDNTEDVTPIRANIMNIETESWDLLNYKCGADFVKIRAQLPTNFEGIPLGTRCASLDGDADRLVYFYPATNGEVTLLDGDHICALFARFIIEQLNEAQRLGSPIPLTFGVVQTAYANGNSTRFFANKLGLVPKLANTGVKHLEEAAHGFDIGLYFEANGHGTVCFSDKFHAFVHESLTNQHRPIQLLALLSQLVNEVVGDGIANLLAVECLLRHFDWSIQDWESETYKNMPNLQLKVPVPDRSVFATANDTETQLVKPEGMQAEIDKIVATFDGARAFIRPSGTEQIIRVYSEAKSQEEAKQLAESLAQMILKSCK